MILTSHFLLSSLCISLLTPYTVLFIDEIHTVVGAGAQEGSMDAR